MNQQELKELRQAQSQGMSLEDFKKAKENKAYKDEVKAIEDSEAQPGSFAAGAVPYVNSGKIPVDGSICT